MGVVPATDGGDLEDHIYGLGTTEWGDAIRLGITPFSPLVVPLANLQSPLHPDYSSTCLQVSLFNEFIMK